MVIYAEQDTQTFLDGQARAAQQPTTPFDKDDSVAGEIFKKMYLARRGQLGKSNSENGANGSNHDLVTTQRLAEISNQKAAAEAAAAAERRRLLDWPQIRELLGWACAAEVVTTAENPAATAEGADTEPAKNNNVAVSSRDILKGGL